MQDNGVGAKYAPEIRITPEWLSTIGNGRFLFGDDLNKQSTAGLAAYRHHPAAVGFLVRKSINASFRQDEYTSHFFQGLAWLEGMVKANPGTDLHIPKIGAGNANKFHIWETIIKHNFEEHLGVFPNVVFLWQPTIEENGKISSNS